MAAAVWGPRCSFLPVALSGLALVLRLAAVGVAPPIDHDEVRYLIAAHRLGTASEYTGWMGPETHVHPLHPWLTSSAGGGRESLERRGRTVTLVAASLVLLPIAILAFRLGGRRVALVALLLTAVHPWLVRRSYRVEPESLYVLLTASAIGLLLPAAASAMTTRNWALAGLLFGVAYLARPEGLLVGPLAGVMAAVMERKRGGRAAVGLALFVACLLLASSPYLLFLRRVTGGWTITGKADHVFIIGQAMGKTRDTAEARTAFWSVKAHWSGILPYVRSHPGEVLTGAAKSGLNLAFWVVPRALGPAGLLGCLVCVVLCRRRRDLRRPLLLILSPCSVLLLMLVVYTSERVVGSTVPFLLVTSALGLAALGARIPPGRRRARALALGALVLGATAGWWPAAWRWWTAPHSTAPRFETEIVALAMSEAGARGRFMTNNPLLSFQAGDPLLFGPSGAYVLVDSEWSCADLVSHMRGQRTGVAVIDLAGMTWKGMSGDPACPLRAAHRLLKTEEDRAALILVLDEAETVAGPSPGFVAR
jgi:4-amino-4-deoxy-L-arabinose transferase-like glycosyltransferase